jgi:beta-glucosidase/6-phospho-beta-glucosidase/beta-galactosidase
MFEGALCAIYTAIREVQDSKPKCTKRSLKDYVGINYYNAVKHAYDQSRELGDYLDKDIKKCDINKNLKGLWEITYWILNEEQKIKMVCRNPDSILVSWI